MVPKGRQVSMRSVNLDHVITHIISRGIRILVLSSLDSVKGYKQCANIPQLAIILDFFNKKMSLGNL